MSTTPWNEFIADLVNRGFDILTYQRYMRQEARYISFPSSVIAAHRERKSLLVATSYITAQECEAVNNISIYGMLRLHNPATMIAWATSSGTTEGRTFFEITRHNALNALDDIAKQGEFINWGSNAMLIRRIDLRTPREREMENSTKEDFWRVFTHKIPLWTDDFINWPA